MAEKPQAVPEGYRTLTPSLTIQNCAEAIEFYKKAFAAEGIDRAPGPDGSVWHATLKIGDSMIMMNDEFPEHGSKAPSSLGGTPVGIWMYVDDVDAAFERAVEAGAEATMSPDNMFWGDRMANVKDPYGHSWSIATQVEDVDAEEMQKRQQQAIEEWSQ